MNLVPRLIVEAAAGEAKIDVERLCFASKQLYDLARFAITNGISKDELIAEKDEEERPLDELYEQTLRSFFGDNFLKQARVLCLTANPLNPAMWANYAENHTGCLLEFCHLPQRGTPLLEALPVSYSADPPCIGSGVDFILYNPEELRGKTLDAVCYTKRKEWEYEQEWRVVTWRSNEGDALHGDYPFFARELVSVTFGLRASEETVADVAALVNAGFPHARLYEVKSRHGELSRTGV